MFFAQQLHERLDCGLNSRRCKRFSIGAATLCCSLIQAAEQEKNVIVRALEDVEKTDFFVNYENGTSHRLLTAKDNMGYTVCYTVMEPGKESHQEYRNHLEACFCISGTGEIEDAEGSVYKIKPGMIYALDRHDRHYLRSDKDEALVLISVFNPALTGTEVHKFTDDGASSY
jgi:L-ectoine synthase